MSITLRKAALGLLVIALVAGGTSCGGASNNDQGTSLLAMGYYWPDDTGAIDPQDDGISGVTAPLFTDTAEYSAWPAGMHPVDGHLIGVFMGITNRMQNMFVRITRIDCSYYIPGTTLQIPDDSYNSSAVIGPTQVAQEGQAVDPNQVPGNILYMGFEMVSPDVMAYLNANQNYLPQLPFRMTATCSAVGMTQAGDAMRTNDLPFNIQFAEYAECCTGEGADGMGGGGFQVGTGTGGDPGFEESEGEAEGATIGEQEATSTTTVQ